MVDLKIKEMTFYSKEHFTYLKEALLFYVCWSVMSVIIPEKHGLSYVLYLVHGYFMFFIGDNVLGNYAVNSLVMLVISFAAAALLHVIIKRLQKYKALS